MPASMRPPTHRSGVTDARMMWQLTNRRGNSLPRPRSTCSVGQMRRLPLVACLLGFSTLAHAQPGAEPPTEPAPPEAPLPPAPPPPAPTPIVVAPPVVVAPPEVAAPTVDKGVVDDANSGRSWLSPTALTPPA